MYFTINMLCFEILFNKNCFDHAGDLVVMPASCRGKRVSCLCRDGKAASPAAAYCRTSRPNQPNMAFWTILIPVQKTSTTGPVRETLRGTCTVSTASNSALVEISSQNFSLKHSNNYQQSMKGFIPASAEYFLSPPLRLINATSLVMQLITKLTDQFVKIRFKKKKLWL